MADKVIKYTLGLTADTSRAKAQLKDLQNQLTQLTNLNFDKSNFDYTTEIGKSVKALNQLQTQLHQSTNKTTGILDLNKFNESLKKSGMTIVDYKDAFAKMGNEGTKAFLSLTESIINAEKPLHKTSRLLEDMKTSLSNTIKWQISSSAIHGFMGAIQGAYGYAQDLNKSLNNIRIVTGQSTDQMAVFAKQANKAAKELSVSTTAYTDAALIYYQQGLPEEEVRKRTETTVKMSNVTGESAADVSSYMTAIWNNFDNGSKSLEYYADVITALGAATAASSEEIAGGLEKFAAVGETVGLSYEYATAALTTIIDKTRQSEDVVGNALKTIFARIQGLQQGEEQEDGVTLNKYSKALENVGISIFQTNGELKTMDSILDEMGSKWETLGKAQQVALAQTVGGTRQYTQLIALMDNWDSMKTNLDVAYLSEGTLQEQANIYAESWEGAQKRVKAAWEDVYGSILNDKFFIKMTNMVADVVNTLGDMIDAMGGAKGVMSALGVVFTQVFAKDIKKGFEVAQSYINSFSGKAEKEMNELQDNAIKSAIKLSFNAGTDSEAGVLNKKAKLLDYINQRSNQLTEEQREQLKAQIAISDTIGQRVISIDEEIKREEKLIETIKRRLLISADITPDQRERASVGFELASKVGEGQGAISELNELTKTEGFAKKNNIAITNRVNYLHELANDENTPLSPEERQKINDFAQLGNKFFTKTGKLRVKGLDETEFKSDLKKIEEIFNKAFQNITQIATEGTTEKVTEIIEDGMEAAADKGADEFRKGMAQKSHDAINEDIEEDVDKKVDETAMLDFADAVTLASQAMFTFNTILNTLGGIKDTLNNKDLTYFEKFKAILGTLMTMLPMVLMSISSLTKAMKTATGAATTAAAAIQLWGQAMTFLGGHIGLVIGVIAVLAMGIVALIADANSLTGRLKKANETLQKSREAAKEAKNAYNDLKSSLDSLKSARSTLDDLKEGTVEWKQAVIELNQQVLDLIEKYPELAPYLTIDENNVMGLEEEGIDEVLTNQYKQVEATQRQLLYDQSYVAELEKSGTIDNAKNEKLTLKSNQEVWIDRNGVSHVLDKNDDRYLEERKMYQDQGLQLLENGTSMSLEDARKIYEEAKAQGRLDDKGNIEAPFGDYTQEQIDLVNQEKAAVVDYIGALDRGTETVEKYNLAIAKSWIATKSGKSEDQQGALAIGIDKEVKNYEQDAINEVDSWTEAKKDAEYMELTGMTEEQMSKAREEDSDFDSKRDNALIYNVAADKGLEVINGRLAVVRGLDGYKDLTPQMQRAVDNYIMSGGDINTIDQIVGSTAQERADAARVINEYQTGTDRISGERYADDAFLESVAGNNFAGVLTDKDYDTKAKERKKKQFEQDEIDLGKNYGMDKAGVDAYQESLGDKIPGFDELEEYDDLIIEITEDNLDWAKSGKKVADTLEEQKEKLNSDDVWEYQQALTTLTEEIEKWTNLDLDSDFVEEMYKNGTIQKMLDGDIAAIAEFYRQYNIAQIQALNTSQETKDKYIAEINDFYDQVANNEIKVGEFNDTDFVNSLIRMRILAGDTVDEINEYLDGMGFTATMTEVKIDDVVSSDVEGHTVTLRDGTTVEVPPEKWEEFHQGKITIPFATSVRYHGQAGGGSKITPTKKSGGGSKKDKKNIKDEKERYHVQKERLEQLEKEYDNITKAKDKAFGKNKLDMMDKEIEKLGQLADAQRALVDEVKMNFEIDKSAVESIGAIIDPETGVIKNYDQLIENAVNKFNNSARGDDDEEAYKKTLEIIKQYEETHDLLMDENAKLDDYLDQISEAKLAKIDYKLEVQIEIDEREIEYLEYQIEKIEDKAFSAAEAIALLSKQINSYTNDNKAYLNSISEVLKEIGLTDQEVAQFFENGPEGLRKLNLTDAEKEALVKQIDGLLSTNESLLDLRDSAWDKLADALEESAEKFENLNDKVQHGSDVLENYKNIIGLVGEETLGISNDLMKTINEGLFDTAITKLAVSVDALESLQQTRIEYERELAEASEDSKEKWEKSIEDLDAQIRDAESTMLEDWESALDAIKNIFTEAIEDTIKAFEKSMSGALGSFEALEDAFDKQKELNDIYLDDYKTIYELTKLTRDITNSIDNTDNILGKQKLKEIQEEIIQLQEDGVELSEYDVEYLRDKYDLLVAQIALEEAQNAKNTVRMTKDSEGNWSYTYTADQDAIDNALQNYEDKLLAAQELNSNYIEETQGLIISAMSEMSQELAKLDPSEVNYQEEVDRVTKHYTAIIERLEQQLNNALGNAETTYDFWKDYGEQTGYGISANEKWVDSFEETTLGMLTGFESMAEFQETWVDSIGAPDKAGTLLGDMTNAYETWRSRVEIAMKTAGTSLENFGEKTEETAKTIVDENQKAVDSSNALKDAIVTNMGNVVETLSTFEKQYGTYIQGMIDENERLIESMGLLINQEAALDEEKQEPTNEAPITQPEQPQQPQTAPALKQGAAVEVKSGALWYSNSAGGGSYGLARGGTISYVNPGASHPYNIDGLGWVKKSDIVGYDTGGYTGMWGSSGRLALLHEKELVLNKDDTENILATVELMREISKAIDLNAVSSAYSKSFNAATTDSSEGMSQNIIINAEFPDAVDRVEIQAAFDNLLNRASQYANRK